MPKGINLSIDNILHVSVRLMVSPPTRHAPLHVLQNPSSTIPFLVTKLVTFTTPRRTRTWLMICLAPIAPCCSLAGLLLPFIAIPSLMLSLEPCSISFSSMLIAASNSAALKNLTPTQDTSKPIVKRFVVCLDCHLLSKSKSQSTCSIHLDFILGSIHSHHSLLRLQGSD
ncbi:hypothetical protein Tco_0704186 [Tanacetum coccineum]|uniref:Uncharacterized protein n=1 Tax=Tanacetum coccineum TaxID=301880 RepID=A0ABQ4Y1X4_9ASTR